MTLYESGVIITFVVGLITILVSMFGNDVLRKLGVGEWKWLVNWESHKTLSVGAAQLGAVLLASMAWPAFVALGLGFIAYKSYRLHWGD